MLTKLKMAVGGVIFISSSAYAGFFSESVDLKKIPQAIEESSEFSASPELKLKEIKYSDKVISINVSATNTSVIDEKLSYIKFSGNNSESANGDEKLKSTKRISKKTSEDNLVPIGIESYGTRTSTLGGLFTLGISNNEVSLNTFKVKAATKAVKEIKGIDGALFPLKVGNALFFSYTYLNDPDKYGITFEVNEKTSAQLFVKDHPEIKELNLIGDIYVIGQEIKSTNASFQDQPCELYYADELSYVIGSTCADKEQWAKSYKLNKLGVSYRAEVEALRAPLIIAVNIF